MKENDFDAAAAAFKWGAFALLFWFFVGFMLLGSKANAQCGVNSFIKTLTVNQAEWAGDPQLQICRIRYERDSVFFTSEMFSVIGKVTDVTVQCDGDTRTLALNQAQNVFLFKFDRVGLKQMHITAPAKGVVYYNRK